MMDKKIVPLHDLTKPQLRLDSLQPKQATPVPTPPPVASQQPQPQPIAVPAPAPPAPVSAPAPAQNPVPVPSAAPTAAKPLPTVDNIETKPKPPAVAKSGLKGGAVASNIGVSEYRLTGEQKGQIVLMLVGLAVLGGVLALIVACIVAYQIYKSKQYSVVTRNQYKGLATMVCVALGISMTAFFVLFFVSDFFRISASGFYLLSFILTVPALALFAYARVSYFNYQADRLAIEK